MRSLYGKFLLFTIGIMLSSALLAFLAVNTFYHQQLKADNDEKNMTIAKNIAQFITSQEDIQLDDYLATQADVGYKIIVVDENEHSTFYGNAFRADNLTKQAVHDVLSGAPYHGMRDLPKETFVTGFFSDESANTVGTPFTYQEKTYALFLRPDIKMLFTEVHYLLGGMFVGMAVISLIAMLFVARKLIQPLTELTAATKKVGAEQFSVSLPTKRGDEIGELAKSFQKMAKQLKESDQMRKQFINDVSHDFQTPLQNIKGYAALLHDEETSESERVQFTKIIESETERLSVLTKQLLLLTSLDALTETIELQVVPIDEQIKEVLQKYRWIMEEKNISLTAEIDEVSIKGNKAYLEKIWENLLSNALKYTPSGGTVDISVQEDNDWVIITCKDSGIGIAEKDIPRLFDRFYRADAARNTEIEGTGLGLAIVQEVVTLHGGKINVESKIGKGTMFQITLPIDDI